MFQVPQNCFALWISWCDLSNTCACFIRVQVILMVIDYLQSIMPNGECKSLPFEGAIHIPYPNASIIMESSACWIASWSSISTIFSAFYRSKTGLWAECKSTVQKPGWSVRQSCLYDEVKKIRQSYPTPLETTNFGKSCTEALTRPDTWRYNSWRIDTCFANE